MEQLNPSNVFMCACECVYACVCLSAYVCARMQAVVCVCVCVWLCECVCVCVPAFCARVYACVWRAEEEGGRGWIHPSSILVIQ